MPKLDLDAIEQVTRTGYPSPYREAMTGRHYRRLSPAAGLARIGASHVVLDPGGISSQRHWHEGIDELVIMLEGEAVLVEDGGETVMRPGDVAAFPAGVANGHHLVNRSDKPCVFVAIDNRDGEGDCHYPDIDLHLDSATGAFTHKDGTPW
ncbi:cupin domain-containing protein [Sphingosinicella ginsenosidimutans]|uniref:Cupin domain-containing protein n=1 Tax=Allosphingosinicella ginsenosidimutans TaxID=1176539 RepID=A0A5C6TVU1_9SPHN|nr:cupin domain-containing protein [Sphingosinicella ginsenosidimutans]TXC64356.1 cupin domain-containing protein [Sphingosinicella ginsenosidimutans]